MRSLTRTSRPALRCVVSLLVLAHSTSASLIWHRLPSPRDHIEIACYKKAKSWSAHLEEAQALGGTLASIISEAEFGLSRSVCPHRFYLGATRASGSNIHTGWYWVDGNVWGYTRWYSGEPNGANELCLEGNYRTAWNDVSCSYRLYALLQRYHCQPGFYGDKCGCNACPYGKYGNTTSGRDEEEACPFECAAGSFANATTAATGCMQCPAGKMGTVSGQASECAACTPCPPGEYSDRSGSIACTACPPGTAQPAHGASSSDDCVPCAPGTFSNPAPTHCEPCMPGALFASHSLRGCPLVQISGNN